MNGLTNTLRQSQIESADSKARLESCNKLLDECNIKINNLTTEVSTLRQGSEFGAKSFQEEIDRLRQRLVESYNLETRLAQVESDLATKDRELTLARNNLSNLQSLGTASANHQATLITKLETDLQTATDTLTRNLKNHDDAVKNFNKQIDDKIGRSLH